MSVFIIVASWSAFDDMMSSDFRISSGLSAIPSLSASVYPFMTATGVLRSWLMPIMNLERLSESSFSAIRILSRFSARRVISLSCFGSVFCISTSSSPFAMRCVFFSRSVIDFVIVPEIFIVIVMQYASNAAMNRTIIAIIESWRLFPAFFSISFIARLMRLTMRIFVFLSAICGETNW